MSDSSVVTTTRSTRGFPVVVATYSCLYYAISAMTLPLANVVWYGEFPVLAIFQLPKSFIKSVVQAVLLYAIEILGWSRGSHSPDYAATHTLAMLFMLIVLALFLVAVCAFFSIAPLRNRLIAAILFFASIDAIVTIWFDSSFNLKLYNAAYF